MRSFFNWIAAALLVAAFPSVATADLSQTITLPANTHLSLETGLSFPAASRTAPPAVSDLLFTGTGITPQGSATAVDVGVGAYNALSPAVLAFVPGFSKDPIPLKTLVVNEAFAVKTNLGRYAKLRVQAVSAASITLQFVTYGAAASSEGAPTITKILNNSSQIQPGLPNYGIAPSSIFIVQGNALAKPGEPALQSSAAPGLPLTLNGASITVVVNGVTVRPALYYTSPGQLAAVLPARTPIGTGVLTVTHNEQTSAPAQIQVVASAVGINTYSGTVGVATDGITGALITYTNSASPGEVIVLWTTGLGANPADSDTLFSASPHSVNTNLQVYFGGVLAKILYQGSAGYPGVNQINIEIPVSVPTGCWVPVVALTNAVVSNIVTLPVHSAGGACLDTQTGLTGNQIAPPAGQTIRAGLVSLVYADERTTSGRTVTSNANAAFQKYTGIYTPGTSVSPGGCILNDLNPPPIGGLSGLDPGTINLTGPAGLSTNLASAGGLKGAYTSMLPSASISPAGGIFTFQGSGGADVGAFTSTVNISSPLFSWTNSTEAASIDRTRGLRVTWSGGTPGSYVFITGTSIGPSTASGQGPFAGYTCMAEIAAGQFTVPSYIFLALPIGNGATQVQNYVASALSASGLDIGLGIGVIAYTVPSVYPNPGGASR